MVGWIIQRSIFSFTLEDGEEQSSTEICLVPEEFREVPDMTFGLLILLILLEAILLKAKA